MLNHPLQSFWQTGFEGIRDTHLSDHEHHYTPAQAEA
jgi:hypothetical protein